MVFRKWRHTRPLWGAIITVVSGLMILWVPFNLYLSTFLPGSIAMIGLLFGGLITLLGLLGLFVPSSSKVLGVITIFLSILSVIGALGGFLFGTIFGIIGGSLMVAWRLVPVEEADEAGTTMTGQPAKTG
ncbi:DUF6114 domain-containing protein [Bacillus sp. T33-2]|uniref:DUF6114 domain-containing protein n=1 Tax=Bacillus sp. T33-2 TaxID=2054168 RepID=UPI000C773CC4|nr:DUF6114 domain-containing protein [Bacillus sp. T33-2]PLR96089.1 hypothetical protein CVD19_12320 [Bacillus sp. T33-2]